MRRGTGRFVFGVVAVVAGGTWLARRAGVRVPGFGG